ncbi:hypothetical protein MIND_00408500 [Mycena indigotica]|uniref:Uncharacterized protein n=1 Tax=Mycena indigotica TaxID=2126181 RepID=A0A8H6WFB1_9AGAR|nr:uncharacterized protein MIND_00408500 [Mycena indigotica]KAF7310344.1 hypothetical protein MIND_00408500 [Mycena indigotica]
MSGRREEKVEGGLGCRKKAGEWPNPGSGCQLTQTCPGPPGPNSSPFRPIFGAAQGTHPAPNSRASPSPPLPPFSRLARPNSLKRQYFVLRTPRLFLHQIPPNSTNILASPYVPNDVKTAGNDRRVPARPRLATPRPPSFTPPQPARRFAPKLSPERGSPLAPRRPARHFHLPPGQASPPSTFPPAPASQLRRVPAPRAAPSRPAHQPMCDGALRVGLGKRALDLGLVTSAGDAFTPRSSAASFSGATSPVSPFPRLPVPPAPNSRPFPFKLGIRARLACPHTPPHDRAAHRALPPTATRPSRPARRPTCDGVLRVGLGTRARDLGRVTSPADARSTRSGTLALLGAPSPIFPFPHLPAPAVTISGPFPARTGIWARRHDPHAPPQHRSATRAPPAHRRPPSRQSRGPMPSEFLLVRLAVVRGDSDKVGLHAPTLSARRARSSAPPAPASVWPCPPPPALSRAQTQPVPHQAGQASSGDPPPQSGPLAPPPPLIVPTSRGLPSHQSCRPT